MRLSCPLVAVCGSRLPCERSSIPAAKNTKSKPTRKRRSQYSRTAGRCRYKGGCMLELVGIWPRLAKRQVPSAIRCVSLEAERSAPSPPSTLEIATGGAARAREIPKIPETQSAASSRRNKSQSATADTGSATARDDVPGLRSTYTAACEAFSPS